MNHSNQNPLRLMPAPDAATIELLYRTFGDVLIPLEKLRVQYFRNLNERSFAAEIESGRIQLPVTTLDSSRKAPKFAHIRHVAALIDINAYKADEKLSRLDVPSDELDN
ncbi:transcriptional regulator [Pseudomonas floridensis]|uniref:Transcriptional regulator n=1 Tax=Pseudomonas floridensis TaxID=1958950 RepID=A0A1X0NAX7_9PSED|nr:MULTISPECIES: pyocin activator PrtN family protein [Pseudomonas]MCQ9473386.1 pyocin activator PrtN family protein [Pseudomonas alliivorans]MEE4677696.1 pyocin activator PrtN family protein [Pseudomonas alliivorans]MEE4703804.1 pyocin activator PrtN family protein [Pseudomonas alliivorans]MEE4739778.1 pyocin activator PrtN family protein [Pseudomonas alliivorans]MEE4740654.1 pyocin activator PrtN family protein [Pseudomonas alliivorans]